MTGAHEDVARGRAHRPGATAPLPNWLAGTLVFCASAAVLVLEVLSLRLVAPYVGLTLETSTAVIGLALAAIATGAWGGGRWADLADPRRLLGPVLLAAGAATLLVLPVVRWAGELFRGPGAGNVLLLSACAIFVPAALLSAVTPLVVKLQLSALARTGSVVGRYSGLGTVGAIVATFGTGFLLVGALPTSVILLGVGLLLVTGGALLTTWARRADRARAAERRRQRGAVALAVAGAALTLTAPTPCDRETPYHCAAVVAAERPAGRVLRLDGLQHSYVDLADPTHLEFRYVQALGSAADVLRPPGQPLRALHVGGGGATLPRYLAATRPGSFNRVLEIDPGVVALDREQLGLRTDASLQVRVADARVALADEPPGGYDLVIGDAFGSLAPPWHLTTVEAAREVQRVLSPDGLYAVNVIDRPPNRFVQAEVATLRTVFPHVALLATPSALEGRDGGNFVVLASRASLPLDRVSARLGERGTGWTVADAGRTARFAGDARPLTDDHAPVDQLMNPYQAATPNPGAAWRSDGQNIAVGAS